MIAQYFPPDMGGGATRAHNLVKSLLRTGCDVTVITAFPHYPTGFIPKKYRRKLLAIEQKQGLKIVRTYVPPVASEGFAKRILLFACFAFSSLFALPVAGRASTVWAANPNIIAMFPSLIYKLVNNCPIIQNVDDLWPEELYDFGVSHRSLVSRLGEIAARITYKAASVITPISTAYVAVITSKYRVDPRKVCVIPAGVDLDRFRLKEDTAEPERRTFIVLYVGAFSKAYNFDQVLEAAKLLSNLGDIKFVIQGGGELVSDLRVKIREKKLRNVELVNKIVSREEVARVLHTANVVLLPLDCFGYNSIELGISSKLYEYQAAGKPIICCSRGQPALYVSETKSGIVVTPGDHQALANAVIKLKECPTITRVMGENGRKYVEHEASIDGIGLRLKEVFETITTSA